MSDLKKSVVAFLAAALVGALVGQIAYADPTRNNRAGAQLSYALNGSLRFAGSTYITTDAGITEVCLPSGSMAYAQADNAVRMINNRAADGGRVHMVKVAADTLYPIGVLRADTSCMAVSGDGTPTLATDGGLVNFYISE